MKVLKSTSQKEMLKNWAIAEATSARRLPYLRGAISADILDKLSEKNFTALNDLDWDSLIDMILTSREELLKGLLKLNVQWFDASISVQELAEARMMNWPPFVELAGSRKLADLATALEQGKFPPHHHEFRRNLEKIRKEFDSEKMCGMPIFVSRSRQDFFYLVEGFTRCLAILLNSRQGIVQKDSMPIIIGFSEKIKDWCLKDDRNNTHLY